MVIVPEGTVVATEGRFVKIFVFFGDNSCQAFIAIQMASFDGMVC